MAKKAQPAKVKTQPKKAAIKQVKKKILKKAVTKPIEAKKSPKKAN